MLQTFMARPAAETIPDQWQSQIFARVLEKARVIYVSEAPDAMVKELHMTPAHSIGEALQLADAMLGRTDGTITAIPDGVSVVVTQA